MKNIYITAFAMAITSLLILTKGNPQAVVIDGQLTQPDVHSTGRKFSREEVIITKMLAESKDSSEDASMPVVPIVARYSESDRAWTFLAKVIQLKDVSIYGRPGTIAQVEYMRQEQQQHAWAVIKIDDYYFSDDSTVIGVGQAVLLQVSGEHVSSTGVNWDLCPRTDKYCEYASFIEGGFPVSQDYAGLTICPSNTLIYSGYAPDDWINGILAWKIKNQA